MLYNICYVCFMFLLYSFLGYIVEVLFCYLHNGKINFNRGFLIGPYLPIYGFSIILISFLLDKYKNDFVALFVMSCVICAILEFFTSLILEKIFKVRWWDYKDHKFNLDGRICLSNTVLFGLGGLLIIHITNPLIFKIMSAINHNVLIIITLILLSIFILDVIVSISVLIQLKISSLNFYKKDNTQEINKLRNERLKKNSLLLKRLLNAFPKVEGKNKDILVEIKKTVNKFREKKRESIKK